MKFSSIMTLTLVLCLSLTAQAKSNPYETKCNVELVRAYGMVGRSLPSATRMEMCPGLDQSCCLKKDQLMMYNQWVHLKENEFIRRRYNHNTMEYVKFLNILNKADKLIEKIEKKLSHRKISNCKELAKRIANYEIPQLVPIIKKNMHKMREFMVKSFEGFYCGICDHENHTHIDVKKKTVTYAEAFCRSVVENTLSNMLFFHVDIVKYVNMVSKFMVSCDFKGDYESEALIPKKHIFFQQEEDAHKLNDCRDNRNKKEWMAYCAPVCSHFSMVNLDLFFEPNIEKIEAYIPWIEQQIEDKKTEHLKHPMFGDKGRILTAADKKQVEKLEKEKKDQEKQAAAQLKLAAQESKNTTKKPMIEYKRPDIEDIHVFKSKMTSKVDLTGYMINFAEMGLSPFESGTNSVITDDMYNEVKTIMHLSRMSKKTSSLGGLLTDAFGLNPNKLTTDEKKEISKLNSGGLARGLASVSRMGMGIMIISLVVISGLFK